MRVRSSLWNLAGPLVGAGVAVVFLLPADKSTAPPAASVAVVTETQATEAPAAIPVTTAPAVTNGAMLSPLPLAQVAVAPAVEPLPTTAPVDPITTASVPEPAIASTQPTTAPGKPAFISQPVNLRAGPSRDTASLAVLQPGDAIRIIEETDGWTYVSAPDGSAGYVSSRFLGNEATPRREMASTEPTDDQRATAGATVRAPGAVAVRSAPSNSADRLFTIRPGEPIRIAETRGRWARVELDSGISGWVRLKPAD